MNKHPEDLNMLVKIPEEDIKSGRHSMAECHGGTLSDPCHKPLAYRMTIEEYPFGEGYYNTAYFCEEHKSSDGTANNH